METYKKKRHTKLIVTLVIIFAVFALLIVAAVSCANALSDSLTMMNASRVEPVTAERRDLTHSISVSGNVESVSIVKITSTLTAKVETLNVELGSEVQEGDVLCVFDSSDLQQQYDTLLHAQENASSLSANTHSINLRNLENAKTDKVNALNQAQRAINEAVSARDNAYVKSDNLQNQLNNEIAQRDALYNQLGALTDPDQYAAVYQQYQEACVTCQTTQSALDALREQLPAYDSAVQNAQDAYTAAERSADALIQSYQDILDAEQYNVDSGSQAELDKLSDAIESCTVRAPRSGIITSLNVSEGSMPMGEALMTIEDADALRITVQISEADILNVHEGQKAVVRTTATGEQEFAATVTRVVNIYQSANPMLGESTGGYSAEITIDEDDTGLLIGMNAKVRIILEQVTDVLTVPYESILERGDGSCYVLRVLRGEDGIAYASACDVTKGMEGDYYTEVTSDVLHEGDTILMNPGTIADGDQLPNLRLDGQDGGTADE